MRCDEIAPARLKDTAKTVSFDFVGASCLIFAISKEGGLPDHFIPPYFSITRVASSARASGIDPVTVVRSNS